MTIFPQITDIERFIYSIDTELNEHDDRVLTDLLRVLGESRVIFHKLETPVEGSNR